MNQKSLHLKDLSKQYNSKKEIFEDISMTINPGEGVGLVGPNGSGKTTFLKLVSVNTFPSRGEIIYGDINIHQHPYEYLKYVGLVHDEESLPMHLSATELLEWILRSRNKWDKTSAEKISRLLDRLDLDESRYDQTGTYSTGMKKKTQIAAALISDPSVLILDEPLRGLDQKTRKTVLELFSNRISEGVILLMASHAFDEASDLFQKALKFPLSKLK